MADEIPSHLHHLSESSPVPRLTRRAYVDSLRKDLELPKNAVWAATLAAGGLVLTLGGRAVLRSPLNVDEELTLRIARGAFGSIFGIVRGRGGGPLHFWLEHLTTAWPGGLAGLRVPSIVFMLVALPAVALIAEELAGRAEAAAAVLLLASAPLAISYSSFGRPHTMLLAWIEWGTLFSLRAARRDDARLWLVGGGVLGSSVFVHPTAPLYAVTAFGTALLYARRAYWRSPPPPRSCSSASSPRKGSRRSSSTATCCPRCRRFSCSSRSRAQRRRASHGACASSRSPQWSAGSCGSAWTSCSRA